MGQFVMSVKGMIDSCKKYSLPVISGNVSLYNETNKSGISPTPVIGMVGLIKNTNSFYKKNLLKENDKSINSKKSKTFFFATMKGKQ